MGYDVVTCPRSPYYFDFVQHESHQKGRRGGANFATLDAVYAGAPSPESFTEAQLDRIVGVQGNIWSEQISIRPRLEFMTFPRIAALSESAWIDPASKDFSHFSDRLMGHLPRMDRQAPDSRIESGRVEVSLDGENWTDAGEFFFDNLVGDPSRRAFRFEAPLSGKYIRLTSKTCSVGSSYAGAADIDVLDADPQ